MAKIKMNLSETVSETFEYFLISKRASGLSDKTLYTYKQHFKAIGKIIDVEMSIDELNGNHLKFLISSMREKNLSANSISSYARVMKTFLSWRNDKEIIDLKMKRYKTVETVKETYSDKELETLLKKPNVQKCNFAEYRTWVIINLLLNNGCRAATIRNIKIKDVDLNNLVIYLRHTKNKKSQVIPLCSELCSILREYLKIRGGYVDEYLFPNENGE